MKRGFDFDTVWSGLAILMDVIIVVVTSVVVGKRRDWVGKLKGSC
jgi:hypothetical protein